MSEIGPVSLPPSGPSDRIALHNLKPAQCWDRCEAIAVKGQEILPTGGK